MWWNRKSPPEKTLREELIEAKHAVRRDLETFSRMHSFWPGKTRIMHVAAEINEALADLELGHLEASSGPTVSASRISDETIPVAEIRPRVLVILDSQFGDRLYGLAFGQPIWIINSPANDPIVRELWAKKPSSLSTTGITGLSFDPTKNTEEHFLAWLEVIDEHHGPYSSNQPYTALQAVGCLLTERIQTALMALGFTDFDTGSNGFLARRSPEQAALRR